ncbi:hypothetical protein FB451DRAFT_1387292 [Mycena latifolia]|nr:hypothetical protein FB451DRAFT_1387292 [Mycena latifolia]
MAPRLFLFHHCPVPYMDSPLINGNISWPPLITVMILATVEPQPVTLCHAAEKVHD